MKPGHTPAPAGGQGGDGNLSATVSPSRPPSISDAQTLSGESPDKPTLTALNIADFKPPTPTMAIEHGYLSIAVPSPYDKRRSYDIDLRRIATRTDLLAWTCHLAGKGWMDQHRLREFIYTAARARGWEIQEGERFAKNGASRKRRMRRRPGWVPKTPSFRQQKGGVA